MAVSLSSLSETRDLGSAEKSREWSLSFFFFFSCVSPISPGSVLTMFFVTGAGGKAREGLI